MLLVGYSFMDVVIGILYVTLVGTVVFILYRLLLKRLSRGAIVQSDFCVLYPLEQDPAKGELEFYFTTEAQRDVKLTILDQDLKDIATVMEKMATKGGNIVRFDSTTLSNGEYFFCLKTENQKTMKKMRVLNV
tara:strand:- start:37 stop:435 length:399 start_codon:yes stop_codon:yes gene_type:complete